MKQLKGKVKETHKEKHQRREDFSKQKERLFTIVLPTLLAISAVIAAYVYFNSRPKNPLMWDNSEITHWSPDNFFNVRKFIVLLESYYLYVQLCVQLYALLLSKVYDVACTLLCSVICLDYILGKNGIFT